MKFFAIVALLSDKHNNLGKISDLYLELLGLLFLKDTENVFRLYSEWNFQKSDKAVEKVLKGIFILDKTEKYYLFFNVFGELFHSFQEFEESLFYLQNHPSKKYLKNISLSEWGNYHLRAIHNQYYILKERTLKLVKTIERIAKREGDKRFSELVILEREITNYFEPLIRERHELIHERAFMDERLLQINARGSKLIKLRKGKQRSFKISEEPDVQKRIKADLYTKSIQIVKELKSIIGFLNTKFVVLSEIVGDWYEDWDKEYRGQE